MRNAVIALCAALALFISPLTNRAHAQASAPDSILIIGEGMKGAEISIPRDTTTPIRVEGRDAAGKPVPIDPAKVVWHATKNRSFRGRLENGKVLVTALQDAFDVGSEPTAMLSAEYEGHTAAVVLCAVLNLEGKWRLEVTTDVINLDLKQSGRWVKDDHGEKGTITGTKLALRVTHEISVIGIPITLTLYPDVTLTSRTGGVGTVDVPNKTEHFKVTKTP